MCVGFPAEPKLPRSFGADDRPGCAGYERDVSDPDTFASWHALPMRAKNLPAATAPRSSEAGPAGPLHYLESLQIL
jgi:hypothetical protein